MLLLFAAPVSATNWEVADDDGVGVGPCGIREEYEDGLKMSRSTEGTNGSGIGTVAVGRGVELDDLGGGGGGAGDRETLSLVDLGGSEISVMPVDLCISADVEGFSVTDSTAGSACVSSSAFFRLCFFFAVFGIGTGGGGGAYGYRPAYGL